MDETKQQFVLAWLAKAENDLITARLLIEQEKRLLDVAVYHCQQTAEKALKSWLTLHDIIFPKTHDLETLLHHCISSHPEFAAYRNHAMLLTPLATEFRYPGDAREPSPQRSEQALTLAEELYAHCEKLIKNQLAQDKSTST